jgi:hypothetical protein
MSLKKMVIAVVLLSFGGSVYSDWYLNWIKSSLSITDPIPHPVYNAINKQLHRHNVHIKQYSSGDGPDFILLSNGKFFDWFSRYNPPQYSFSDSMKKDMDQYTVTHILENEFAIVALAHKPGHPTKTEVFAGGYKSCGGEIKKAMQMKMDHYTVTQIFHIEEYPYDDTDAFVALAHKPGYPNQTKVFVWGNKEDGGKIDKAMQSDMDHYTVTQIVSTLGGFVALGHKADYPNQTKVFAWGDKDDAPDAGGKIKKAIQSQMDQYTVTKIDLAGSCVLAFSHKPNHPNQTKVFSWGGDVILDDDSRVDCDKMIRKAMKGNSNRYVITKISHIGNDDKVVNQSLTTFVALAHKSDNPNKTKVFTWGKRCDSCSVEESMPTVINQYTVTQIVHNGNAFVALAHKPGHPDKTKVFAWGVDGNGYRIGKAMQSDMDKYTVTQVVCADDGCAALAHEPGYPNKTKVFGWHSTGYCIPYGDVYCVRGIDKSLQKKMDRYTVTKIIGYPHPPDSLRGGAFFAIAYKPGHPKETKVFQWGFF